MRWIVNDHFEICENCKWAKGILAIKLKKVNTFHAKLTQGWNINKGSCSGHNLLPLKVKTVKKYKPTEHTFYESKVLNSCGFIANRFKSDQKLKGHECLNWKMYYTVN